LADLRVQTQWSQPGMTFFDADLEHYALGDEQGNVSIREVATHREAASLPGMGVALGASTLDSYHAMQFSSDNEVLAVRNRNGAVQVWNWRRRELIFPTASQLAAYATGGTTTNGLIFEPNARLQFTPDSHSLAVVQADGTMRVFALANGSEQQHFTLEKPPFNLLRFSPAGDRFCLVHAESDEHVQLHRASDGQLLKTFSIETGGFNVAWHPDGKRLVTGGSDQKLHLWDVDTGNELASFSGHQSVVSFVAFSHNGNLIASASWDGTTRMWDTGSGKELLNLRTYGYAQRFSRDDHRFVRVDLGPRGHELQEICEVALGDELRTLPMPEASKITLALHFSPDGRLLASAHVNVIAIWDTASARQLATLPGGDVGAVRFSAGWPHVVRLRPEGTGAPVNSPRDRPDL
jgi:WD40 repeat protein